MTMLYVVSLIQSKCKNRSFWSINQRVIRDSSKLYEEDFWKWVVKAAIPGDVPAVPQRHPQLVLRWADDLTEQPQGRLCQQRRDHRGRQVCGILWHHLRKNGGSEYKLLMSG